MLFNSYYFIFLFFPIALAGYYLLNYVNRYRTANIFLIGPSGFTAISTFPIC